MHVVFHHRKYYDWVPVPADVKVEEKDLKKKIAKPGGPTGMLTRVTMERKTEDPPTFSTTTLPEHQVIALIVEDMVRYATKRTRNEAVCHYLARHCMWHNAHESWLLGVEVDDDGPSEDLFRAKLQTQVEGGNIDELDIEPMVKLYMGDAKGALKSALEAHFSIKPGFTKPEPKVAASAEGAQQ